jgi:uncharacterized phage protein gp47/JayE
MDCGGLALMAFLRPTLDTLRRDARAAFDARLPGADAGLRFSVLSILADVQAAQTHLTFGHLDWIARQVIPDTAEGDFLDRWCGLVGLSRRVATQAAGNVTLSGTPAIVVASGTRITRADGTAYLTTVEATIGGGGSIAVAVEAEAGGEGGNATAGTALTLSEAVVGVSGVVVVASGGLSGGAGAEDDESLRARLRARLSTPPQGGAATDYIAWALEVPGVTRVWVTSGTRGPGTVDVLFVLDGRTDIIPLTGDVAEVQAYLEDRRPVTADVLAVAPVAAPLAITITGLSPDTADVRASILVELEDQIRRDAEPGGTIRRSRLIEAISRASGESFHNMTVPSADVTTAAGSLRTLGTVTFV